MEARSFSSPHHHRPHDVVDLTSSPAAASYNNGVVNEEATTTVDEYAADDDDDDHDRLRLLVSCEVSIVGIRYYDGVARPGEFVNLVREPNNVYDRNAIRVDNMRNEKVGHVKKQAAAVLAGLMDLNGGSGSGSGRGGRVVTLDGTIPRPGNAYTLPLSLELYYSPLRASPSDLHAVHTQAGLLRNATGVKRFQQQHPRVDNERAAATRDASAAAVDDNAETAPAPPPPPPVVTTESKRVDWQTQREDLDAMFEKQLHDQLDNLVEVDTPSQLQNVQLHDYQKLGIRWMVQQERSDGRPPFFKKIRERGNDVWLCEITNCSQAETPKPVRGGILADEMGIGKTLQAIGLILANPATSGGPKTTLIVCPVSVMSNWVDQINRFVRQDALRVEIYQGPNRSALIPAVKNNEIDVLIVSYHTLAADLDSGHNASKENLSNENTAGNKKKKSSKKPSKKRRKVQASSSILDENFRRIVLDEAHNIRNAKTGIFRAVAAVKAECRLCLTGTPFVNRADDIHSLLTFLNVQPLADREVFRRAVSLPIQRGDEQGLCRLRTTMAHVALRRTKAIANVTLVEKEVQLRSVTFPEGSWHKRIHDSLFDSTRAALEAALTGGDDDGAVLSRYTSVLESLLRIRQACCSGLLVPKERRDRAEEAVRMLGNLVGGTKLSAEEGQKLLEKLRGTFRENDEVPECAVCLCEMDEAAAVILRSCSHVFCEPCIARVTESSGYNSSSKSASCPLCRTPFDRGDMIRKSAAATAAATREEEPEALSQRNDDEAVGESPKVSALLQAVEEMQADEKGVIFSQFTKYLDLIQKALKRNGHSYTRIDGSKSATDRIKAVTEFNQEHGGPRFILCSLHAAGTGINLTRGNWVFLMDCWWNQAVESQAMDRVHRLGQKRKVRAVRLVMKDSIEERIVAIQESKAALSKGAMEKLKPDEKRKARITDLKDLFLIGKSEIV